MEHDSPGPTGLRALIRQVDKSGRSKQVEIITGGERRSSWTLDQKREIVAESFSPELTPSDVARKHVSGRASFIHGAAIC
jgi:hypothetical protein